MGIDWKNIAIKQREEFLARQAEEKAAAQQEMFEESKEQDAVDIDEAGVQFDVAADEIEEEIDDTVEATVEPEKADIVMDEDTAEIMDEYVEPEEEKEETELEKAARIAKEKQRLEGLNVKEKQEYKSKFEELADAKTKQEPAAAAKPKYKKYEEKEEPRRKATFDLNKKDYGMKPIYSEEELAEIEREQMEEEENDWIHDDIDFDEYDEYYDK